VVLDLYTHNAVAWLGAVDMMVKYEDLVGAWKKLDSLEAEVYFRNLLGKCGIDPILDELPDRQMKLVEFIAPCLRKLLGYE
jgi:hypothetical protein